MSWRRVSRIVCGIACGLSMALGAQAQTNNQCDQPGEEPDIIVGSIYNLNHYGPVGEINAYSIGTESCNLGTCWANWISGTPNHPVIGQSLFRLKNGRFEQVGQSWLKHGFAALNNNLCGSCIPADGSHLGVRCSDPYSAGLNGSQSNLGPKNEVNAKTGSHLHPFSTQGQTGDGIYKRLQVHNVDLDPLQNAGALYFVEGQYVAADDAAAGNNFNNASYRRVTVSGSDGNYNLALTGGTFQQQSAINAWAANDSDVAQSVIGQEYIGAAKVSPVGGDTWHYEYALQNLISHDSAQAVRIPIPHGATITNIGFHDVNYHSGEPYAGTDWTATIDTSSSPNAIVWSTQTFAQNQNANALRWGTLYNFRFDTDVPPVAGTATIVAFRPGALNKAWLTDTPERCGDAFCDSDENESSCETDCSVGPEAGMIATPLYLTPAGGGDLALTWGDSCMVTDVDYEIYEGKLGDFTSHEPFLCSTDGMTSMTITPRDGDTYYLIVPHNGLREGSYGRGGDGRERAASFAPCRSQSVNVCD